MDSPIFFAREEETRHLLQLVGVYRGVMLYGDSGVGKSSLINAGLLPAAVRLGFQPERIRVQPREGQEIVVERIPVGDEGGPYLASSFAAGDERSPVRVLSCDEFGQRVREMAASSRPLLVFDQFEELVTLFEEAGEQQAQQRITDMLGALLRGELPVKLLFVFREDYLARVKPLLAAAPELIDQALRLRPPEAEVLPTIIRGPFERNPGQFEHELHPHVAEHLRVALADRFGSGDVSLSEVQTVCLRLWRSDEPDALLQAKGVQGLLEDYLGEELDRFPEQLRYAAGALLSQMVTAAGTRNVISADDLIEHVQEEEDIPRELLDHALDRLERESKLVRRERRRDLYLYEITSEFLVPWISRRRQELIQSRERQARQRRLLITGAIVASVALVAVIASAGFVWALGQRNDAREQRRLADERAVTLSRELAKSALSRFRADPGVSFSLAGRALQAAPTAMAEEAVRKGLLSRPRAVVAAGSDPRYPLPAPVFTTDGGLLQTWSYRRGLAQVWRTSTGERVPFPGPIPIHSATSRLLSPDGRFAIIRGSGDAQVRELATRDVVATLKGERGVTAADFSPDGKYVLTSRGAGKIRVWEAATGRRTAELSPGHVFGANFGPDERTVVVRSFGRVSIWDTKLEQAVATFRVPEHPTSVLLSRDGKRLRTRARRDATIWDVATRKPLLHATELTTLFPILSAEGRLALTRGPDGLSVWDLSASPRKRIELLPGTPTSAAFSEDDRLVAYGNENGDVRVWDRATGRLTVLDGHTGSVALVLFGRANALLSAGDDFVVRIWDAAAGASRGTFTGHRARITAAAFSADGRLAATQSDDGTTRVWNVAPIVRPLTAVATGGRIDRAAFSRNGRHLVASMEGGGIRVWDGRREIVLRPAGKPARAVGISPEGRFAAAVEADGRTTVWHVGDARSIASVSQRVPGVAVAVGPEAALVAVLGADGTVRVWDVARNVRTAIVRPKEARVSALAFRADGLLVVGTANGTVLHWRDRQLQSLRPRLTFGVAKLAFSHDGRTVVAADRAGGGRAWVVTQDGSAAAVPVWLQAGTHVAVNPDGKVLLASTADALRVVGARAGIDLAAVPTGARARAVSFDSDGRLVVAERGGAIRTYACEPCGLSRELRTLVIRRLGVERTTG